MNPVNGRQQRRNSTGRKTLSKIGGTTLTSPDGTHKCHLDDGALVHVPAAFPRHVSNDPVGLESGQSPS
jgi:hypothetical protein